MQVKTNNQLKRRLKKRGINVNKYDEITNDISHYQLINGYKMIFISSAKKCSSGNLSVSEKRNLVNKYNLQKHKNMDSLIDKLDAYEHNYFNNTSIKEMKKYYDFERELSVVYTNSTLEFEEKIKTLIIKFYNDRNVQANYLIDIHNYKVEASAFNTLNRIQKIITQNKKEETVKRKLSQGLFPPFWILIHKVPFGTLLHIIDNVKDSEELKEYLIIQVTNCKNVTENDKVYYIHF